MEKQNPDNTPECQQFRAWYRQNWYQEKTVSFTMNEIILLKMLLDKVDITGVRRWEKISYDEHRPDGGGEEGTKFVGELNDYVSLVIYAPKYWPNFAEGLSDMLDSKRD